MKGKYTVGVDIGGTNIRIGAVDDAMNLISPIKIKSDLLSCGDGMKTLAMMLREYISDLGQDVCAVSLGFPSSIDAEKKMVLNTPNLSGFNNVPVVDILSENLGLPVILDRDANMLLSYDIWNHELNDGGVIVGIYIGTGIGNSICIHGELISGKNGIAGELGHIPIMGREDACTCGLKGCAELFAGGKAIDRFMAEHYPEEAISEAFTRHAHEAAMIEYLNNVAVIIATEINILDPDYVILGGGVIGMQDFPKEQFQEMVRNKVRRPEPAANLQIVFSDTSDPFNGVVGAAIMAKKRLGGGAV